MAIKRGHTGQFPTATHVPISEKISDLPNLHFGPQHEPEGAETDAIPEKHRGRSGTSLSTSAGHTVRSGAEALDHASTKVPLEKVDFVRGQRPETWPPSFEKP